MKKNVGKTKVHVEVELTDGYKERFTLAVLKIYAKRMAQQEDGENEKLNCNLQECKAV